MSEKGWRWEAKTYELFLIDEWFWSKRNGTPYEVEFPEHVYTKSETDTLVPIVSKEID